MKPQLEIFNYSMFNKADDAVDIHIDGDIVDAPTQEMYKNFWGDETSVSFRSFRDQIESLAPKALNVYINSTGGHVGDAMAMHDYLVELQNKGTKVNTIGRGIIASAATYLLMAGDNSEMSANSTMMIHNVSMYAYGDINQLENQVKAGRKFNNAIRDFYANKTGKPAETITAWMNKETWFNAAEAKANGFVKNVTGEAKFSNSIPAEQWPFQNKAILNQYNSFTQNQNTMDIKKISDAIETGFSNMMKKLGLENKIGEEGSKTALNDFATVIVNAFKDEVPTNEAIQKMVNDAITEATKDDATVLENAVKEGTKNFINKTELETQINTLKTEVIKNIGGASGGEGGNGKKPNPKNRFSGRSFTE